MCSRTSEKLIYESFSYEFSKFRPHVNISSVKKIDMLKKKLWEKL